MFDQIEIVPVTHLAYIGIGVAVTVWVARTLRIHGHVFLARGCKGNVELAESLSHLFSVGFYLMHVGFLLLALQLGGHATNLVSAIELLSTKIGLVLVVLAISHFAHVALYSRIHGKPRLATPTGFESATPAQIVE